MELVDGCMRHGLGPRANVEYWNKFRQWVERHPQPENVGSTLKAGTEFVKLEVRKMQVAQTAVLASTCQPSGDRAFAVRKHVHGRADG